MHSVRVYVDYPDSVPETDEGNNEKEISLATFAPDLAIQTVTWAPEAPAAGDNVAFNITVKNQGDLEAGSTYLSYYIDNTFMGSHRIENMGPGSTVTRTFTWTAQSDSFVFSAVIDKDGEIPEKDEANNSRTVILPAPDLSIDAISWSPANPTEFSPMTFTVRVANRGHARSSGAILSCLIDGAAPLSFPIHEIDPGSTATTVFTYTLASGEHTFKLTADSADNIAESDETNNEKTASFYVGTIPGDLASSSDNSSTANLTNTAGPPATASPTLPDNVSTEAADQNAAANISAPPPKWQSILQSKLFIFGFGGGGIAAIGVLLFLRKKLRK